MATMLRVPGAGVCDIPLEFMDDNIDRHTRISRTILPFIEMGLSDRDAWEALFDDAFRIELAERFGPWTPAKIKAARKRDRQRPATPAPMHMDPLF